jgi:hypothetical protein
VRFGAAVVVAPAAVVEVVEMSTAKEVAVTGAVVVLSFAGCVVDARASLTSGDPHATASNSTGTTTTNATGRIGVLSLDLSGANRRTTSGSDGVCQRGYQRFSTPV